MLLVRSSQRRVVRRALRVNCQVIRERDFRLIGSRAVDLSTDGMLVMSDERVLTGEDVIVTFQEPRSRIWFDAEAIITRVVHGRRETDGAARGLGLVFEKFDDRKRRFLRTILQGVPPPLPRRKPRVDYAATIHMIALS